jgi:hypothetical protein
MPRNIPMTKAMGASAASGWVPGSLCSWLVIRAYGTTTLQKFNDNFFSKILVTVKADE